MTSTNPENITIAHLTEEGAERSARIIALVDEARKAAPAELDELLVRIRAQAEAVYSVAVAHRVEITPIPSTTIRVLDDEAPEPGCTIGPAPEPKPKALYDLPIFGWAWREDGRDVER